MERIPWRHLLLATAAGTVVYFACWTWWPKPKPRIQFPLHWLGAQQARIDLSPDASLFAITLNFEPEVHVFRAKDGKKLIKEERAFSPHNIAFSPKGDVFALYSHDEVQLIHADTRKPVAVPNSQVGTQVLRVCFDSNGRMHALVSSPEQYPQGQFLLIELDTDSELKPSNLSVIGFGGTSSNWAWSVKDTRLRVLDITTGKTIDHLVPKNLEGDVVIAGDGNIAFAVSSRPVKCCDLTTGHVRSLPFTCEPDNFTCDGKLAIGRPWSEVDNIPQANDSWFVKVKQFLGIQTDDNHRDGLCLFDTTTGTELGFFDRATAGQISADGRTLAILDHHNILRLWDLPMSSFVLYWVLISTTVGLAFFWVLRKAGRKRQPVQPAAQVPAMPGQAPESASSK